MRRIFACMALFVLLAATSGLTMRSSAAPLAHDLAGDVVGPHAHARTAAPDQLPRNQTLYISGIWWGTPTNFNPLNGGSAWPASGNYLLTYETLFAYNQLTGHLDPLLAESYQFASDSSTVTIALQDGTLWQDGEPLTTEDVVYTYELAQSQPGNPYSDLFNYISDIQSTGERTLLITLNDAQLNPGMVKHILANVKILPKHIWQPREAEGNLVDFVETNPIGSGPYGLQNFSFESVILIRDEDYWGVTVFGLPAPKYVVHNIYEANDDIIASFENANVDMSQVFIPEIWKLWEEQGLPIGTWFDQPPYHLPGTIPILIINTTKPGLDDPLVRRALAYSIDYAAISTAVWGYSDPVKSSLILPYGGENELFDAELVDLSGWEYDPAVAQDILENQLGATQGDDGIYILPGGTRLGPWSARCPNNWTDWQMAIETTVQSAQEAGIDLYTDYPEWSWDYFINLQLGDFDLAMIWTPGSGPASPWQRFRDMIDPREVPPIGESAPWNFGRFIDPEVPPLLDLVGQAVDPTTVKDTYGQLDKIFMDNAVDIPLMYRPSEFYEFNTTYWGGFPTEDDPSAPPMFQGAGIQVLYQISAVQTVFLPVVKR